MAEGASAASAQVNQRNAHASTGPITRSGKLRVRRNALKHGLAAGPLALKFPQRRIQRIVNAVVPANAAGCAMEAGIVFATAQLAYERVLRVRKKLVREKRRELKLGSGTTANALLASNPDVAKLDRYERRALKRRIKAAKALSLQLAYAEGAEKLAEQSRPESGVSI
jgi:hypothetical protein